MTFQKNRVSRFVLHRGVATPFAILILSTVLAYAPSLGNGFVTWDDDTLITGNPAVQEISLRSIAWGFTNYDPELYIPLTFVSFQLDWWRGGGSAFPFHLGNLILHLLNTTLVILLAIRLTGNRWIALTTGALFALHPIHTEAVAWASARKDVLSAFFFLLSTYLYIGYQKKWQRSRYLLSIGAFLLGLFAKVSVLMLPFVLLLLDVWKGRKINKNMLLEKVPYVALSLIFGMIALFGKRDMLVATTLWEKILMACKSNIFFLEKLFLPQSLSVLYPYTGSITLATSDFLVPLLLCMILACVMLFSLRYTKHIALAACYSLLMLLPHFTNFAKGQGLYIFSDRYAYLPSISIFLLVAGGLWHLCRIATEARQRQWYLHLGTACVLLVCLLLGFLSFQQSHAWRNTETLMRQVLRIYPSSHVAQNNLGVTLF